MSIIIQNQPEEQAEVEESPYSVRSFTPKGMPHVLNPHAGESRLAATLDEIDVLKEQFRRALEYMEWFQPAWDALTDDEQFVLSEFYLKQQDEAVTVICKRFPVERSSAYNKKNRALARLTTLLYGK